MTNRIDDLVEQVKAPSPQEQAVLLNTLHDLLSPTDAEWEAEWLKECEDRVAAYERGEAEATDFDEAIAQLKAKYGRT